MSVVIRGAEDMMQAYLQRPAPNSFLPLPRGFVAIPETMWEHLKCPVCKHSDYASFWARNVKAHENARKKLEENWKESDGPLPPPIPHPLDGLHPLALERATCTINTPAVVELGNHVYVEQETSCENCGTKWVRRRMLARRGE